MSSEDKDKSKPAERLYPTQSPAETVYPTTGKMAEASNKMRGQFEKAKAAQLEQQKSATPEVQKGRDNGPAPAPGGMDYKLKSPIGRHVDKDTLQKGLTEKANDLKALNDSAKARHNSQKNIDLKNDRDKDNDDRSR